MKTSFTLVLAVTLIFFLSCKKDAADPTVDCSTSQSRDIENFFNTLNNSSGYFGYDNMDLESHEYTFTVNNNSIQICGFGYKSQNQSLQYEIKLTNNTNSNSVVYSGNMSFSSSSFSYTSIPPVTLQPGTYTLTRTLSNYSSASDVIGPVTRAGTPSSPSNPNFPITIDPNITITGSNFYGGGGPVPNYGVPNIYFEYIEL